MLKNRNCLRALAMFIALGTIFSVITAEAAGETPNLIGSWQGEATVLLQHKGETEMTTQHQTLEITQQDGVLIRGIHSWRAGDVAVKGHVSGQHVVEAHEPFLGAIGQSGRTLRMVETDDPGMLFGVLNGTDEMEVEYFESGTNAVVWNAILRRKPR